MHSARFPGETYAEKFATMFGMLDARGVAASTARFVCALALVRGDERAVRGTRHRRGRDHARSRAATHGFGYDPIFFYPPFDQTLAEVPLERKRDVSHRGKAFEQLKAFLIADRGL